VPLGPSVVYHFLEGGCLSLLASAPPEAPYYFLAFLLGQCSIANKTHVNTAIVCKDLPLHVTSPRLHVKHVTPPRFLGIFHLGNFGRVPRFDTHSGPGVS